MYTQRMFAPPPIVPTTVFARIPEKYSKVGQKSQFVEVMFRGRPTAHFIEGPSFDLEGNLWIVDIPYGRLFKIDQQGNVSLAFEYDGEPNGLKFHKDGRAFIADHKNGIMVFDPKKETISTVLDRPVCQRLKGVNDLIFASNGDLYFTDQGQSGLQDPSGRLYRLRTNGQLDCILNNVPSPNGLVLTRDETAVLLAATRANAVWRVPLMVDGTASKVGNYIQMSGGAGPDGMALDSEGSLAVCHARMGCVWLFDEYGEPIARVNSCADRGTTNCAYGGADNDKLYITESDTGTILVAQLTKPGNRMYSHQ